MLNREQHQEKFRNVKNGAETPGPFNVVSTTPLQTLKINSCYKVFLISITPNGFRLIRQLLQ